MADFDQLIDEFLRQEFEDSPVSASGLGLTEFDDRLDDLRPRPSTAGRPGPPTGAAVSVPCRTTTSRRRSGSIATWRWR